MPFPAGTLDEFKRFDPADDRQQTQRHGKQNVVSGATLFRLRTLSVSFIAKCDSMLEARKPMALIASSSSPINLPLPGGSMISIR
jgi:hypothetical protein